MLSYAFFYFVGQNVAWLLSSWLVSLLICAVAPVAVFIFDSKYAFNAITVFVGWASVVVIPEFVLKIGHVTFDSDIKNQLLPLLAVFDALVFVVITIIINVNDSSPAVWTVLLGAHVLYVWGIWHVNFFAKRIREPSHARSYFATYLLILIINDLYFLVISLIIHGHPLNFIAVFVAGCLTAIPLLFASHDTFQTWIAKQTTSVSEIEEAK